MALLLQTSQKEMKFKIFFLNSWRLNIEKNKYYSLLEIRSMERGNQPNPVWLHGAMWNCSVCIAMESFVASVETFSQKNKHRKGQRSLAERRFIHALIHDTDIEWRYIHFHMS
jgi:hypothetical protein